MFTAENLDNKIKEFYRQLGFYFVEMEIEIERLENNRVNLIYSIDKKEKFIGHVFSGKYLDCGTLKGYINSSIEISKL